jgi:hypothetical protein
MVGSLLEKAHSGVLDILYPFTFSNGAGVSVPPWSRPWTDATKSGLDQVFDIKQYNE